jgi:CheY-like chemotaxis protein
MKILYVEDNDDNVYMLKNRLMRAGFSVIVANDGAQGLAMAASEQPDLILMDLTLPNMDGEEATRRPSGFRLSPLQRMRCRAIGRKRLLQVATTSIPNRWSCHGCSARSMR